MSSHKDLKNYHPATASITFIAAILLSGSAAIAGFSTDPVDIQECHNYAKKSVTAALKSEQMKCGFKPPVWSKNYSLHYDWCMRSVQNFARRFTEMNARTHHLQKCAKKPKYGISPVSPGVPVNPGNSTSKSSTNKTAPLPGIKFTTKKQTCDTYADKAVQQNAKAKKKHCGFKPPVWSSNRQMHFNWCMRGDNFTRAAGETANREQRLSKCTVKAVPIPGPIPVKPIPGKILPTKDKTCRHYALTAVNYNIEARKLKCGFRPPVWSNNHQMHYDWCMRGNNFKIADRENVKRAGRLSKCVAKAKMPPPPPPPSGPDLCDRYANEAVKTAAKADALGCGFVGPRWLQSYKAHYNFCKSKPHPAVLKAEHTARDQQYAVCEQQLGMNGSGPAPMPLDPEPPEPVDWVFPDSDIRLLTDADVSGLSSHHLWWARNEIFARKGYRFKTTKARKFFEAMPWYQPVSSNVSLNAIERANVDLIRSYE